MGNPALHSPLWNHFKPPHNAFSTCNHGRRVCRARFMHYSIPFNMPGWDFHCWENAHDVNYEGLWNYFENYFSTHPHKILDSHSVYSYWFVLFQWTGAVASLSANGSVAFKWKQHYHWLQSLRQCGDVVVIHTPRTSRIFIILNTFWKATNKQLRSVMIFLSCPVNM